MSVAPSVIAFREEDYVDWHKHRPHFCLWYIEVDCPLLRAYCHQQQAYFKDILAPHYQRQFHITLFVNGFWELCQRYDDDFTPSALERQIQQLKQLQLNPFDLTLQGFHSFDTCLSIRLQSSSSLSLIRQVLCTTHQEISPCDYVPHITLGFYRAAFLKQVILQKMAQGVCEPLSFSVRKLTFGYYQAQALQGKLTSVFELNLED